MVVGKRKEADGRVEVGLFIGKELEKDQHRATRDLMGRSDQVVTV